MTPASLARILGATLLVPGVASADAAATSTPPNGGAPTSTTASRSVKKPPVVLLIPFAGAVLLPVVLPTEVRQNGTPPASVAPPVPPADGPRSAP